MKTLSHFKLLLAWLFLVHLGAQAAETDLRLPPKTMNVPLAVTSDSNLGSNDQGIGLVAGTKVPDFTLKSLTGEPINLEGLLEKAPVLVIFYRGG